MNLVRTHFECVRPLLVFVVFIAIFVVHIWNITGYMEWCDSEGLFCHDDTGLGINAIGMIKGFVQAEH